MGGREEFVESVAARLARGEPAEVALLAEAGLPRDSLTETEANALRSVAARTAQSLDKKFVGDVLFSGKAMLVSTVNGRFVRKRRSDGGCGCQSFVGGMNGGAARDPRYRAEAWCGRWEICLNNILDPVDFLSFATHEAAEQFGIEVVGLSYDDAHDEWGDPWEDQARHLLETEDFDFGDQPSDWLRLWPTIMARISR